MTQPLPITFISDYGLDDGFVGVCHAVIATRCPRARIIDLTHSIPPQDVRRGAVVLRDALPYLPTGVHLAIVDPGVGGERRAVALRTVDERLLVGPDNGLLTPAAIAAGGISQAVDIATTAVRLQPVSATFHGRDIFAPAAAALAAGAALLELGLAIDPDTLVRLDTPAARLEEDHLVAHVELIDRFGNLSLDAASEQLLAIGVRRGETVLLRTPHAEATAQVGRTFADVDPGALLVYEDAYRHVAIAVRNGDAASRLSVAAGASITLGRGSRSPTGSGAAGAARRSGLAGPPAVDMTDMAPGQTSPR